MKVVEYRSKNKLVEKYVSKYQLFEVDGPLFIKAVPSGTVECWIVLNGYFETFDPEEEIFKPSKESGFFPIGTTSYTYFIPEHTKCFNIKMKPITLGLPNFNGFIENWKNFSAESFLSKEGLEKIKLLDFTKTDKISDEVDTILMKNDLTSLDPILERVLTYIFSVDGVNSKVSEIANKNYLSVKSLERLIKRLFGMSPKRLLNIIRFGMSADNLKKNEGYRFIDTLEFGYYDQSHFIRECKRITQLNPKEFLSKLNLDVHDLIVKDL